MYIALFREYKIGEFRMCAPVCKDKENTFFRFEFSNTVIRLTPIIKVRNSEPQVMQQAMYICYWVFLWQSSPILASWYTCHIIYSVENMHLLHKYYALMNACKTFDVQHLTIFAWKIDASRKPPLWSPDLFESPNFVSCITFSYINIISLSENYLFIILC